MAEQWIDAATARGLIASAPDPYREHIAALALCRRAHSGILAARATLLTMGDRRAKDATIPAAFWWAEGEAALDQDWATGDFSTWINRTILCQAFGVTFAISDVLDMLPAAQRNDVARRLSVAGIPKWVRANEAAQLACCLPGVMNGRAFVVEQAHSGLLQGRAVLAQGFTNRHAETSVWEEREWAIPADCWNSVAAAVRRQRP